MGKKILFVLLTTFFIFGISEPAFATDLTTNGSSANVPVRYTVDNTEFVITIPTVIAAGTESTNFTITASYMNLRPDEHIEIYMTEGCNEEGKVVLSRQNVPEGKKVATLETTLSVKGQNIKDNGYRVGYFEDSDNSTNNLDGEVTLSGLNVDENTEAGDYETTVCFKVELKNEV